MSSVAPVTFSSTWGLGSSVHPQDPSVEGLYHRFLCDLLTNTGPLQTCWIAIPTCWAAHLIMLYLLPMLGHILAPFFPTSQEPCHQCSGPCWPMCPALQQHQVQSPGPTRCQSIIVHRVEAGNPQRGARASRGFLFIPSPGLAADSNVKNCTAFILELGEY